MHFTTFDSAEEFAEEFKGKLAAFSRTLRGLEDRAKKCESLKSLVSKVYHALLTDENCCCL